MFLRTISIFPENATALDPEDVTVSSEGSVKQHELDDLLPSIPSLPSVALPKEISSNTPLGTAPDNEGAKLLLDSIESSLSTTPVKPDHEAASEQREEEAAQDHE